MRNVIDVNEFTRAFHAAELGDMVQRGLFKQVGQIRTEYFTMNGVARQVIKRENQAVIHDLHLQKYYAVEQYRGIAIRAEIRDEEMLAAIIEMVPTLEEGEGFVYDQSIELKAEEIDESLVRAPEGVEVNDGTEDLNA
ncbi:hypothetical protein AXI70_gp23 [Cronobacter phage Dev-CD-23823]|uniref:Uncharacterized protein n=1 Tax=Cronobacter phage Dev-CD-23823 TaxID=1712539 RepID=A0A0K8IWK8_9CAUD|nr:hypothetical protein AXI70_gp23 [Cronobacter phage Dev-CD-23823]CUH74598.1 hypothetical protein [Cronobacter phage Dev-CD-23823]